MKHGTASSSSTGAAKAPAKATRTRSAGSATATCTRQPTTSAAAATSIPSGSARSGGEMLIHAAAHSDALKAVVSEGGSGQSIRDHFENTSALDAIMGFGPVTAATALFTAHLPPPLRERDREDRADRRLPRLRRARPGRRVKANKLSAAAPSRSSGRSRTASTSPASRRTGRRAPGDRLLRANRSTPTEGVPMRTVVVRTRAAESTKPLIVAAPASPTYGRRHGGARCKASRSSDRQAHRRDGAVRLRQVDADAHLCRPRQADRG